jgi:trimeric autotransporter adhesin
MLKKGLAVLVSLVMMSAVLPSAASAVWQLQTQNTNQGGTITTVRNGVSTVLTASGTLVLRNYTGLTPVAATVHALPGFQIKKITTTGVLGSQTASDATITGIPAAGLLVNSVVATYMAAGISVTTGTGITPVNPASTVGGTVVLTVTPPTPNNIVSSISVSPAQSVAFSDVNGNPVTLPNIGTVKATITGLSANCTVTATFARNPILDMRQNCNTCHITSSPNPLVWSTFPDWSSSRHKVVNVDCITCHASMPGGVIETSVDRLTFKVTAASAGTVGTYYCVQCHVPDIMSGFEASLHKTNGLVCTSCHVQGSHNPAVPATACNGCHLDAGGNVALHPVPIAGNACISCHNPHSTVSILSSTLGTLHYNNITAGRYPASYVTSRASCADCHSTAAGNLAVRQQWYTSGHARTKDAPWVSYDFKTRSGCVQCHTTTGFIAYSSGRMTAAWGTASDKTKELLTCKGCHTDIATGALRTVVPVSPFAGDSYQNPNVGKSNLCMDCHSGTNNGTSITAQLALPADFTNLAFISPHYLAAGGTLFAKSGYHFPGRSYPAAATHAGLGSANGAGPCVSCHKNDSFGHTFRTGAVAICAGCHGSALPDAQLALDQASFAGALEVLRAQLAANGFVYTPTYPYFANRNWGAGQAGANTMGAAYNYVLMLSDPGAYAHNPGYARQLVLDSIDYLDNGQFDDSVTTLALPGLLASGAVSPAAAATLTAYKAKNLCITCHGGTASSTSPMASGSHSGHLTGLYGPGNYLGSDVASCQACHLYGSPTHLNGVVDLVNGAGSACQGCHAGGAPAWTGAGRLDCTTCHAATPARLPNGVAAPYKGNFLTTGHGQFAASGQCTVCHDPDSRHISGTLGSYTRLRMLNDNSLCASCHATATVGASFRNMSSHVTIDGRVLNCRDCHDPHGSTNLSMIRQTINGVSIVFTDLTNGMVDPVTNRGLCQVCHTLTAHYRAGVAETGHYSSGCLNCHSHNSAGGAFRPSGGACDSCHGYPPVPRNTGNNFGTTGNWAGARFEDYSGGGGAHLATSHISPFAVASEGWANCAVCHNAGKSGSSANHRMTTPVQSHIDSVTVLLDPALRFSSGFAGYTAAKLVNLPARNATGSCFNVSCHMSRSPRWSTER